MILIMAFLQMVGVASVMPFVQVLSSSEIVENNKYLFFVYDYLGFESTRNFMYFLGIVMLVLLLGSVAFQALTNYAIVRYTHMRGYSLSRKLVQAYLRQPYDWFLDHHSADLGKSILSEANQVIQGALLPLMKFIAGVTMLAALIGLLVAVEPMIALIVALSLGGAYGLLYFLVRKYLDRIGAERVKANKERFQAVQEAFGGIKEVKVSGLEAPFLKRFEPSAKRFARVQANANILGQIPKFGLQAIAYGGAFIVILYMMNNSGGLKDALPILAIYLLAGQRLLPALSQAYKHLAKLRFTKPALETLYEDLMKLDTDAAKLSKIKQPEPMGMERSLKMDAITYTYPKAHTPALQDLSLEIPAKTTMGLVGATGSGKTTTVDVILGLLWPQQGRLLVDNTPVTQQNLRAWQRALGYVPQHIYLADETVSANIAFGVPPEKVDMQAVERAARVAELHDFVTRELSNGYETLVGERGVRLSGGQRQRIGIARALYHDPPVLDMDEATSALDNVTEKQVMNSISNMKGKRTIILIAHRLSTVRDCDMIYFLEQGKLKASGTYEELVNTSEEFRRMAAVND
ncbi:MAG: ABC transporter ATP-binding protein [Desulfosalsimonas sp.]